MAKRSCIAQLVEVFDLIGSQLDKGGQVDIIYLDMFKAFDKVNYSHCCNNTVLPGTYWLGLIMSSEALPVTSGVPQGSILGPMLFLLFANSLPDIVKSSPVQPLPMTLRFLIPSLLKRIYRCCRLT